MLLLKQKDKNMSPKQLKCCIPNCAGSEKKFRFPENYKKEWCDILKMDPSQLKDTHRVCELHFDASHVFKRRIMKGALPTRMLGQDCDSKYFNEAVMIKQKTKLKCCVRNCSGSGKKFRFPKNSKKEWCEILKMDPTQLKDTHRVCELHFETSHIFKRRLMKGVMPTRMLGQNFDSKYFNDAVILKQKMKEKCCVPNCAGVGKKFRFPKNYKTEWCEILKMDPSKLKDTHRVCELHFDASHIFKRRIMKGAMPTRMLGQNCYSIHLNWVVKSNEALQNQENDDNEENSVSSKAKCDVHFDTDILVTDMPTKMLGFNEADKSNLQLEENDDILKEKINMSELPCELCAAAEEKIVAKQSEVQILQERIKMLETENSRLRDVNIELGKALIGVSMQQQQRLQHHGAINVPLIHSALIGVPAQKQHSEAAAMAASPLDAPEPSEEAGGS